MYVFIYNNTRASSTNRPFIIYLYWNLHIKGRRDQIKFYRKRFALHSRRCYMDGSTCVFMQAGVCVCVCLWKLIISERIYLAQEA